MNKTTEGFGDWSCYSATPAESLALFEAARGCPVVHSEAHDGFTLLLDYKAVRKAMADHRRFSSEPQVLRPMLPRKPIPALEMDPPRHSAWRAIFSKALPPGTDARMEPFVRADIRRHLGRIGPTGACDIVKQICEPVPAETICHLVGVDEAKVPAIRHAAIKMFAAQGDPELFGQQQAAFGALTIGEVHDRRAHPREDFLTSLVGLEVEGRALDDDDFVVLFAAFLGAGHHSTSSAMASLIWAVFSDATLRNRLRGDRSLIGQAVEETLRLYPPFYGFFRRTTCPIEVNGAEIPEGRDIYMGWAAANRDPEQFERPHVFDIGRASTRHMAFGFGIHSCPGAALARMELTVLLDELLDALPDLSLDGPAPAFAFGGGDYCYLPSLNVRFTPKLIVEAV
ncbi:cytochrome P450 [Sphingobium sp. SCG-1]|uniref:cytochrome P450 n=1 Tax=Sphingobium sp. SCG-1 TaxID=2072936 RepID=UPI000CD680C8|nr:cytochrome P450 [Sphingobium sp. SCG-1]AUW58108.1 cytochrome P450 [Sphingobium sp. SCG-1]